MKNKIKIINEIDYGTGETLVQFFKEGWQCHVGDDVEVPMTIVASATDMLEATGEDEFKDYPVIPELGIINKNCHPSISLDACGEDFTGEYSDLYDVHSYCGFACYMLETFLDTDRLNNKLLSKLSIQDACLKTYKCRFTGENKSYPAFKTEEKCIEFLTSLVEAYGDMHMTLIGFALDRPVNLIGETGWRTVELCINGLDRK